jgi:hypothetical protein
MVYVRSLTLEHFNALISVFLCLIPAVREMKFVSAFVVTALLAGCGDNTLENKDSGASVTTVTADGKESSYANARLTEGEGDESSHESIQRQ